MSDPEVTGMTERAMFCMQPEGEGGCDETLELLPVHFKRLDPITDELLEDKILGWLCKEHALKLALKNMGPSAN